MSTCTDHMHESSCTELKEMSASSTEELSSDHSDDEIIVISSDSEIELKQVAGSPLKVINAERYRKVINELETVSENIHDQLAVNSKLIEESSMLDCNSPIYEKPPDKYAAERVVSILLDKSLPPQKVCSVRPTQVAKSATYVIDITKLAHPDDVKHDNFGVWSHSGSHTQFFRIHSNEEDGIMDMEKCCPGVSGDNVVILRRLHSVHPSNKQFKRMIAFLCDASNNPHHLCLVVYHIPSGFIPKVQKHGNAKGNNPFHPTWTSTKSMIKKECLEGGPKETVASVSAKSGGMIAAIAPGLLPRNEKQVSNFRKNSLVSSRQNKFPSMSRDAAADDLFVIMQQAYSEYPHEKFIRAVNAAPEPAVVVATDIQLQDLSRCCTNPTDYSPLTVDPTFCLGAFDVTIITFQNRFLLSKRTQNPPIFIGPTCIHYKKNFSSYLFFASTIVGQQSDLERVRVIGTDGEEALIKAFIHEFGMAQHLTCFIHFRRNVKQKLHECKIDQSLSCEILDDVFGKKLGTTRMEGLVDAYDVKELEENTRKMIDKWLNTSQPSYANVSEFVAWFEEFKIPIIQRSMLSSIREDCGLGSPPIPFTTNACEAINSVLKKKVDYKKNQLPEFIGKLKELVCEQYNEMERAIIGRGKYELHPKFKSWELEESKWFSMSSKQRQEYVKKFYNASLSDEVPSGINSSILLVTKSTKNLSIPVEEIAQSCKIPLTCLQGIWSKAAKLLTTEGAIVPAPGGKSDSMLVLSYQGKRPHLVESAKKTGSFSCDDDCPNWKSMRICSHCVAVAEYRNKLPEFINLFEKCKQKSSLSKLAEVTMPKGRGKKGGIIRKRKSPALPILSTIKNPCLVTTSSFSITSTPPLTTEAVSTNASTPTTGSFQSQSLYPYSWPSYPPYFSPFATFPDSMGYYNSPPAQTAFNYGQSPGPHSPPLNYGPSPSPHSPFILCKISGNISVCIGCRNKYVKASLPPDDLCIQHKEWREFTPPGSDSPQSKFANVYYHFHPQCVWLRCSWFQPSSLQIPSDVEEKLTDSHKNRLLMLFQIQV